ncbi:MAG TPA: ABC transporter permease [Rhodothermales bacterium]|nr:ABC transporter permease [Rhodothermales bacterium]
MIQNYLKIALRNLYRNPGYSFITILGLAVGIACALFVLLYLQDETGFDEFHHRSDRIYRIVETRPTPDRGDKRVAFTAGVLAPTAVASIPGVESAVRMVGGQAVGRRTVSYGDRRFYEADYLFTEPEFFDVFNFPMKHGTPETALSEPRTVVLTESAVAKYFGDEDPLQKLLTIEQFGDFVVTGIIEDPPSDSHLHFSMLLSLASGQLDERWVAWLDSWENESFIVYVVLEPSADPAQAEENVNALLSANLPEAGSKRLAFLQAITDIHFGSGDIEVERHWREGDARYLYIFSAIGAFLILIASINYMNMTTARSMRRAREIGLRKVAGGQKGQLVRQFLAESLMTTAIAVLIAVGFVNAGLPLFNQIAGKALETSSMLDSRFVIGIVALTIAVGIVAGSYPAFYLARFKPSQILLHGSDSRAGAGLRRGLVVAQFTLSIIMIAATTVVYNQLRFVQSKPLGFNQDRLVVIDINSGDVRRDWETVRAQFASVPSVQSVSATSRVPGDWKNISEIEVRPEGATDDDLATMHFLGVDEAFIPTYEVELAQGRNFSRDRADSASVILNEAAARLLGIITPDRQVIEIPAAEFRPEVIGIVKDFNYESLHSRIGPLVIGYWSNPVRVIDYFTARVSSNTLESVIPDLRAIGEVFDPSHPFEYNVLEQRLGDFYKADRRAGTLFGLAATLAILIACLGLAGLAAYTAERRTKEIGVRKVLGASVKGIIVLLSRDFALLVVVAFLIAAPLAYLAMDRWLSAFAYRTDLTPWIFVLSGAAALALALATVSFQAVRSALANPVESLRYE